LVELVESIGINEQWKNSHEKGNRKGKLNGLEVPDALDTLGIVVLNVVHAVNR